MVYGNWENIEIIGVFAVLRWIKLILFAEMKGTIPAHGHYFCSERCIRKYEAEKEIMMIKNIVPVAQLKLGPLGIRKDCLL